MESNVNNPDVSKVADVSGNAKVSVSTAQNITSNQPAVVILATTVLPNNNSNDDSVFENFEENQDNGDASSSRLETVTRTRVSHRELQSLSSHNVPGEEELAYCGGSRRVKLTLDELRRRFKTNMDMSGEALDRFPNEQTARLQLQTGVKGVFGLLKSAQVQISDFGGQLKEKLLCEGMVNVANSVEKTINRVLSEVKLSRETYEDVLSATSTWAPRRFPSCANSVAGSHYSKSSHNSRSSQRTTTSKLNRRKNFELQQTVADMEAQEGFLSQVDEMDRVKEHLKRQAALAGAKAKLKVIQEELINSDCHSLNWNISTSVSSPNTSANSITTVTPVYKLIATSMQFTGCHPGRMLPTIYPSLILICRLLLLLELQLIFLTTNFAKISIYLRRKKHLLTPSGVINTVLQDCLTSY